MHLLRLLAVALWGALVCLSCAQAAPMATPYDLYEWGPVDDTSLETLRAAPGDWQVLHQEKRQERTWLLLGLPEGRAPSGIAGGPPSFLGRVHEGERVVLVEDHESAALRVSSGRSVIVSPAGRQVFITSQTPDQLAHEASHCFHVVERTQPPPAPKRSGPPDRLVPLLERASPPGGMSPRSQIEVEIIRDRVSADSLQTIVRTLSTLPSGAKRSRYFARPETETVSRLYIATKLEEALGAGAVSSQAFVVTTQDTSVTVTNVIGKLSCGIPNAGAFLITAHYDAIGTRSDPVRLCEEGFRVPGSGCNCAADSASVRRDEDCEWNWRTDPAPGADDNATGVACLLEAARALKDIPLEFDIIFVAFQGEELGLLGSEAYADSIANENVEIFGVFNMDMLGYNALRNEVDLVTNESSEWFGDYIESTSFIFTPNLLVNRPDIFFPRSDHASFWAIGVDAVDLTEDVDLLYPKYHTFQDTWENTFARPGSQDQLTLSAKLLVSAMARFSLHYDDPDFAIPSGELEAVQVSGDAPRVGTPIRLTARMHNYGASSLTYQGVTTDSLTARVTFY
ncbi:MAG TPA: M20/M25/M40 family metallo-hydrolase, partial [bacterium]|nr:M20/M25/M40 family metallo-hydrolase [bacterium]